MAPQCQLVRVRVRVQVQVQVRVLRSRQLRTPKRSMQQRSAKGISSLDIPPVERVNGLTEYKGSFRRLLFSIVGIFATSRCSCILFQAYFVDGER